MEFLQMMGELPKWVITSGILIASMIVALIASYSYSMFYFIRTPLMDGGSVLETPVVKMGEMLIIRQVFRRNNYCRTDADRFIIRQSDGLLVRRERLAGPAGALGDSTVRIAIPTRFPATTVLPFGSSDLAVQDLQPGSSYILRVLLHSDCGDRTHTLALQDMTFAVVE
jgi:hypothetical protein